MSGLWCCWRVQRPQDWRRKRQSAPEEVEVAQCWYNLWQGPRQPTSASYNNPNGIDDLDLGSTCNNSDNSASVDASEEIDDLFDVNLMQTPVTEESRERTFEKGDKPRDISKVKNNSYWIMVAQLMEHEGIAKHGETAAEAC